MTHRNQPSKCHCCGVDNVKPHCDSATANCDWIKCRSCGAVSGYIFTRIGGQQTVVRNHFGGSNHRE